MQLNRLFRIFKQPPRYRFKLKCFSPFCLWITGLLSFTFGGITFANDSQVAGDNLNPETTNEVLKLGSEIKGHQEQPKVLFILPWQTPETDVPDNIETPQILPEYLLSPIDRAEFNRQSYLVEALKN